MRVTDLTRERNFLYNITKAEARLGRIEDMATSGMRFSKPQEDPIGAERSLIIRHQQSQNQQYLRNVDRAKTWMADTEQALTDLTDILIRAQYLATEGGTATTPDDARAYLAMEVKQLLEEIQSIEKTTIEGGQLLVGTMPTWRVGSEITITVDEQSSLIQTVRESLEALDSALSDGEFSGVHQGLSDSLDLVLAQRASNGAKMNRLNMLEAKMKTSDIEFRRLLSNVEDIDLTEVIVRLRSEEAAYQAALGVGARILQSSLLNHLR